MEEALEELDAMRSCEVVISDKLNLNRDCTAITHDNANFTIVTGASTPEARTMIVMPREREMQVLTTPELVEWCQKVVDVFTGKRRAALPAWQNAVTVNGNPGTGGQLSTTRRAVQRPGSRGNPSNTGSR